MKEGNPSEYVGVASVDNVLATETPSGGFNVKSTFVVVDLNLVLGSLA